MTTCHDSPVLTGDEIVILDREMQRLRAENAKLRELIRTLHIGMLNLNPNYSKSDTAEKIRHELEK